MPLNVDPNGTRILRMVLRWRAVHFSKFADQQAAHERARRVRKERLERGHANDETR